MNTITFIQSANRKRFVKAALAAALGLGVGTAALAADSAGQTVSYTVSPINEISVSGTPSLTVGTATAGSAPNAVTSTAAYAITTNEVGQKITGKITGENMPSGVTLYATLAAPANATSTEKQALTTTAVDLVTGISTLNESAKLITYELAATSAAGALETSTRTVTFTITAAQ